MKQANNTEIDRLLQRHARRWNTAMASTGRDQVGSQSSNSAADGAPDDGANAAHLDADEMSAYAEGALPASARARYMTHLADCDSCRRIVTDLVLAANVAAEESVRATQSQDVSPSKPWWSAIAALFAPPVLRYAIPALLLFGVIVVALVATRDRREAQFVARNEEKQAESAASKQAAPEPPAQISSDDPRGAANDSATTPPAIQPGLTTEATPSNQTAQTNANAVQDSPAQVTETKSVPADDQKRSPERKEAGETDGLYANEPKAAPAPPAATQPAPSVADKVKEEERASREQNDQTTTSRTETTADASGNKDKAGEDASLAAGTAAPRQDETAKGTARRSMRNRPATGTAGGRSSTDEDRVGGSSTEERSVGGRRFRRQGNAWIDTAYSSSRSTINVARGSDQYRSLAADEPGLRSIAEQLGGEVVVVWKGKAYRIY